MGHRRLFFTGPDRWTCASLHWPKKRDCYSNSRTNLARQKKPLSRRRLWFDGLAQFPFGEEPVEFRGPFGTATRLPKSIGEHGDRRGVRCLRHNGTGCGTPGRGRLGFWIQPWSALPCWQPRCLHPVNCLVSEIPPDSRRREMGSTVRATWREAFKTGRVRANQLRTPAQ